MNIAYTWLQSFIDLGDHTPKEIADKLTGLGLEVEAVVPIWREESRIRNVVLGTIQSIETTSDNLHWVQVGIGDKTVSIACRAQNISQGMRVAVALPQAQLYPWNATEPLIIESQTIAGSESCGMLCSAHDLGIGSYHMGVWVDQTELVDGTPWAAYFAAHLAQAYCLQIGLTPNRGDAISHYGVARDLAISLNRPVRLPKLTHAIDWVAHSAAPFELKVSCEGACPRYAGLLFDGVQIAPSAAGMQLRLLEIGLTPINNVVDIGNYVMHAIGQPVHAFDFDALSGDIHVCYASDLQTPKPMFQALNQQEYALEADDVLICDKQNPVALAGIIGSANSAITVDSKRILLEVAYFDPTHIRRTAKRLRLATEAAFRYERGIDPARVRFAAQWAAQLLKSHAQAQLVHAQEVYPEPLEVPPITLRLSDLTRISGCELPTPTVRHILRGLDMRIQPKDAGNWQITIPYYRHDVRRPIDVIEEILRVYGYEKLKGRRQLAYTPADTEATQAFTTQFAIQTQISDLLVHSGFMEMINTPILSTQKPWAPQAVTLLHNAQEETPLRHLRTSLWEGGLQSVWHNIRHKQYNLRLFEWGKAYAKTNNGFEETNQLALYMTGAYAQHGWRDGQRKLDMYDLMEMTERVLTQAGVVSCRQLGGASSIPTTGVEVQHPVAWVLESDNKNDQDNQDNQDSQDNPDSKEGQVLLAYAAMLEAENMPAVYATLIDYAQVLLSVGSLVQQHASISLTPEVRRDLSIVLDDRVAYADVHRLIAQVAGVFLYELRLFSVYRGAPLEVGTKSYALSLVLKSTTTWTDAAISGLMGAIMDALQTRLRAIIRVE